MRHAAWISVAGAAVALVGSNLGFGTAHAFSPIGWLFSTVYVAEFDHTSLAAVQLSLGALASVLAVVIGGLGVWQLRQQVRHAAAGVVGAAALLVLLAMLTYQNVYALVPCAQLGFGVCDANGGLIDGTWVQLNGIVWQVVGALLAAVGGLWSLAVPREYSGQERFLQAQLRWNGQVVVEHTLHAPRPLSIGESALNDMQVCAPGLDQHIVAVPIAAGAYRIDVPPAIAGTALLNGLQVVLASACSKVLTAGDALRLNFENDVQLHLQFVSPQAGALTASQHNRDATLVASFAAVVGAALVMFVVAASTPPLLAETADREALMTKNRGLIEINIELPHLLKEELPIEVPRADDKDPAKRASGEQGKLGDPRTDPRKPTKIARQDGPQREKIDVTRIGVAQALMAPQAQQGALGNVMAGTSDRFADKMAVAMAGDAPQTDFGHGSNGRHWFDTGSGGGGPEGPSRLVGLGPLPGDGDGVGRQAKVAIGRKTPKPPTSPIIIGQGQPSAGCNKGDIRKNVLQRASMLRACYETALLAKPDLSGKLSVQWTIDVDGKVSGDRVTADSLGSTAVSDCVLRSLRRIQFAPPEAGVCVVAWPFVFNSN